MTGLHPPAITGIDTHAHVFRQDLPMVSNRRYSPHYDALVEQYLAHLDRHGLSHGVLIQPSFLGTDNHFMLDALRRYPQRLRGVAVVDASISDTQLDELEEAGVVGIRLNLIGKALTEYASAEWLGLFARLGARGWQVEIQRGIDDVALVIPGLLAFGVTVVIAYFGAIISGCLPAESMPGNPVTRHSCNRWPTHRSGSSSPPRIGVNPTSRKRQRCWPRHAMQPVASSDSSGAATGPTPSSKARPITPSSFPSSTSCCRILVSGLRYC